MYDYSRSETYSQRAHRACGAHGSSAVFTAHWRRCLSSHAAVFRVFPLMAFGPIGVLILVVLAGCGAYMVVIVAVVWRGTVCVLTSERVIFVEQRGLLNRTVCDASVLTIQDVAYRSYGMFGKLFFIGMVRVVFRGVVPDMRFSPVAHPEHLTRLIHELRDVPKRTSGDGTFSRRHIDVT